jgi:hypothetical protein
MDQPQMLTEMDRIDYRRQSRANSVARHAMR